MHYTGGFTLYVNQQTLEPLSTPTHLPMTVERTVKVQSGNFSTALVTEDDTIKPGPLTFHQEFRYLLNRRTMAFENSAQTQMFSQPAKAADIAGTYRVNFPLGTSAGGVYPVLNTETDKAANVTDGRGPHTEPGVTGVQVIDFKSDVTGPVSPYYHTWLVHNGFPASITPAQFAPRLSALGVNVTALLGALAPRLTPAQATLLDRLLTSPIPLDYTYYYRGSVAIEPRTGAMIHVDTTAEGVNAAPSLHGLDQLRPLLTQYASVPGVATLSKALGELSSAPPQRVVDYTWDQTRASSQHVANLAVSQMRSMNLVEALPWIAGIVGLILLVVGLAFGRPRRTPAASARGRSNTGITKERAA